MTKQEVRSRIEGVGIVPAIRVPTAQDALFAVEAVSRGGIPIVEITMTIPGAAQLIADLVRTRPDLMVGAGTVLDVETARQCVDAGAAFITSTGLDRETAEFVVRSGVVMIPGVLTPTEVLSAWKAGADLVKVYPCAEIGGPGYVRALKAPFPQVPLIASGGVKIQTVSEYIAAGAVAIGVGAHLIPREAVQARNAQWIGELARRFTEVIREAQARFRPHSAEADAG